MSDSLQEIFTTARKVGADVVPLAGAEAAATYLREKAGGTVLLPPSPSLDRLGLAAALRAKGCDVIEAGFRTHAPAAAAGVTGACFALADTGTVVLHSTDEAVRLATTLPERHFVLLDPAKILPGIEAATAPQRELHRRQPRGFLAYVTGPSRTADIERVLTIGVHGPRELHVLLVEGLSKDALEM